MMKEFWLCFVPLFVAVDAVGVLPIFLGMTEEMESRRRRIVLLQSFLTASIVAILFLLIGPRGLDFVNITISDFMIAGGLLLLIISLTDLITGEKRQRIVDHETMGAVPIGVPLISGPAVLTTSVLLVNEYGILMTSLAVLINIAIAITVFWFAVPLSSLLGSAGSKVLSKIASLFLASIAIMLIRKGIIAIVSEYIK
jgi:multiple antibiotic resistance protein